MEVKEPVYKAGTTIEGIYGDQYGDEYKHSLTLKADSNVNDALLLLHDLAYTENGLRDTSRALHLKEWDVKEPPKQD